MSHLTVRTGDSSFDKSLEVQRLNAISDPVPGRMLSLPPPPPTPPDASIYEFGTLLNDNTMPGDLIDAAEVVEDTVFVDIEPIQYTKVLAEATSNDDFDLEQQTQLELGNLEDNQHQYTRQLLRPIVPYNLYSTQAEDGSVFE